MFIAMADYFVNQLKISWAFYETEFKHVNSVSKKGQKFNSFGSMLDYYLRCKQSGNMSFFETESGKNLCRAIERATEIEEVENGASHYYRVKINKKYIDPAKNETNISKAAVEFEKFRQMVVIHNNNAIISMMMRLESFFQGYFEWLAKKYPEKYLQEKSIRYSELVKFDYDEMKAQLTKEAADTIMSQPLGEWLKTIRSHKYNLEPLSPYFDELKEIYYRRNIIVHNNGDVNRAYLLNVGNIPDISLGQHLKTDKSYIMNAFSVTMIVVYGILYASLKSVPNEKEDFLNFLFNSGFNHMLEKDWKVGKFLFSILISETGMNALDSTLSQINYWICCKNSGEFKEIREAIERTDYSAMSLSVRMAKEMLLEHFDKGVLLLEDSIAASELTPDVVETWPIFLQFRKSVYYQQFRQNHAEKIEEQAINTAELSAPSEEDDNDCSKDVKDTYKENILG